MRFLIRPLCKRSHGDCSGQRKRAVEVYPHRPEVLPKEKVWLSSGPTLQPLHYFAQPPTDSALSELDASRERIIAHVLWIAFDPVDVGRRVRDVSTKLFPANAPINGFHR